jgi:hypothetical protein
MYSTLVAGMSGTLLIVLQRMSGWHYWLTDCRAPLFEIAEESYRYGFSNLTQLKTQVYLQKADKFAALRGVAQFVAR